MYERIDKIGSFFDYKLCDVVIPAVYTAGAYEDYRSPYYDEKNFGGLLDRVAQKNLIDKNILKGKYKMLTLSTCSDIDDRLVVHAVCIE